MIHGAITINGDTVGGWHATRGRQVGQRRRRGEDWADVYEYHATVEQDLTCVHSAFGATLTVEHAPKDGPLVLAALILGRATDTTAVPCGCCDGRC